MLPAGGAGATGARVTAGPIPADRVATHPWVPHSEPSRGGRIVILSASVGAGHDGAARELARRLTGHGCTCTVHDFLDLLPGSLGRALRGAYALQLRAVPGSWGWLHAELERSRLLRGASEAISQLAASRMLAVLPPDTRAVVSAYPLASQAAGRLRRAGRLGVPVITYLTDMSVHPLWVAPGVDAHLALHAEPARQASRLGAHGIAVVRPAVPPAFAPVEGAVARARLRHRLGLPVTAPLALIVAGSWGVGEIDDTVAEVAATGLATPVVACGRNDELRRRVDEAGHGIALGWTDAMPELLAACDVVVQNAGGLTSLEAMAVGTPLVSYRCVPGHGLANSIALDRAGLVPLIQRADDLAPVLQRVLSGAAEPALPAGDAAVSPAAALFDAPGAAETVLRLAGLRRGATVPRAVAALRAASRGPRP
nr:glycosyltransferase [Pseudonocardia acidicola]